MTTDTPITAQQLIEALDFAATTPDRVLADRVPKLVGEIERLHTALEAAVDEALRVAADNDRLREELRTDETGLFKLVTRWLERRNRCDTAIRDAHEEEPDAATARDGGRAEAYGHAAEDLKDFLMGDQR